MSLDDFISMVIVVIVVGALAYHLLFMRYKLPALDDSELLGTVKDWEVRVVDRGVGPAKVAIAMDLGNSEARTDRQYILLEPSEARQLAQWLRWSAAPGSTLAVAKRSKEAKATDAASAR